MRETICAIANNGGGIIIIGVDSKGRKIVGCQIHHEDE